MCDDNITLMRFQALVDKEKSRDVIAKAIKCNTSTITKHYNGDRTISTEYIIKYSKYFNVSADYLLGLSDVATMDKDIKFVCDYTGLSEEAINTLHQSTGRINNKCGLSADEEIIKAIQQFSNISKEELQRDEVNYDFEKVNKILSDEIKSIERFYEEEKIHLALISCFLSNDDILHEFTKSIKIYMNTKEKIKKFETEYETYGILNDELDELISSECKDIISKFKIDELIRTQKIHIKEELISQIDYPIFKLSITFKNFCENLWSELNNGND